jgi:hypothetical protein
MRSSGCFCDECRAQFRAYLHDHPTDESADLDPTTLDYREFLLARVCETLTLRSPREPSAGRSHFFARGRRSS